MKRTQQGIRERVAGLVGASAVVHRSFGLHQSSALARAHLWVEKSISR